MKHNKVQDCTFIYPKWVAECEQRLAELEEFLHYMNGLIVGSVGHSVGALARVCEERRHLAKCLEQGRRYLVEHRVFEKVIFHP